MEDDLKYCPNRKCKRYGIEILREAWRCSVCNQRLRRVVWGSRHHNPDTPPLIDYANAGGLRQIAYTVDSRLPVRYTGRAAAAADTPQALTLIDHGRQQAARDGDFEGDVGDCGDIKGCPIVVKPRVEIPLKLFDEWIFLANEFNTEWAAYLKGVPLEGGGWRITEMYFPPQIVNSGHVAVPEDALPTILQPGTIGAVHSHVDMKAFFSGEDEKHANHDVELVVNRRRDIESSVRVKLQCGRYSRVAAELVLIECEDRLRLAEQLKAMFVEPKPYRQQPVTEYFTTDQPTATQSTQSTPASSNGDKQPYHYSEGYLQWGE